MIISKRRLLTIDRKKKRMTHGHPFLLLFDIRLLCYYCTADEEHTCEGNDSVELGEYGEDQSL